MSIFTFMFIAFQVILFFIDVIFLIDSHTIACAPYYDPWFSKC